MSVAGSAAQAGQRMESHSGTTFPSCWERRYQWQHYERTKCGIDFDVNNAKNCHDVIAKHCNRHGK